MSVVILILAAGSSSRMRGADKLLQVIEGEALLTRQARRALGTGYAVIVTLPPDRPGRAAALAGLDVTCVVVPEAAEGMSASLRAGVAAAGNGPVLVLLADLPEITTADLRRMLEQQTGAPERILRATAEDGTPGHPVIFPAWALPELVLLTGDTGARDVLKRHAGKTDLVALPDRHAVTDLDTPEDWADWRARQS